MKKIVLFLSFSLGSTGVFAQSADFWSDPFNHPLFPLYALSLVVFIVIVLVAIVALYLIKVLNILIDRAARERAEKEGRVYVPAPTIWQSIQQKLTDATPVEKEQTIVLDHEYDGIRELDNHLPPWWKWLFYFTIAWAFVYYFVYHVEDYFPLPEEEYLAEVAQYEKLKASQPEAEIDEANLTFTDDAAIISKGAQIFADNCATCHRADAGGDAGPNLTDDYWLHGGDIKDIYHTVKTGVPQTQMISWASILKPESIRDVAFYVKSLHGSNPENPKAPQGELYAPKDVTESAAKPDSVIAAVE